MGVTGPQPQGRAGNSRVNVLCCPGSAGKTPEIYVRQKCQCSVKCNRLLGKTGVVLHVLAGCPCSVGLVVGICWMKSLPAILRSLEVPWLPKTDMRHIIKICFLQKTKPHIRGGIKKFVH